MVEKERRGQKETHVNFGLDEKDQDGDGNSNKKR